MLMHIRKKRQALVAYRFLSWVCYSFIQFDWAHIAKMAWSMERAADAKQCMGGLRNMKEVMIQTIPNPNWNRNTFIAQFFATSSLYLFERYDRCVCFVK